MPISNIEKIIWFSERRAGMIYLKTPSEFGRKINFYPNVRYASDSSNPAIEEFRELKV